MINREIKFILRIQQDRISISEENSPHYIEFRAARILKSENMPEMLAHSLVDRIQDIIRESLSEA